ncbi:hypothetical protein RIF29_38557 [Crotalaria pallida]|uniref:Uncharacterized protein n=1 Tax=Crotalaria pallida TaxID=3830 RepID=A0AAN9E1D2_CROPI
MSRLKEEREQRQQIALLGTQGPVAAAARSEPAADAGGARSEDRGWFVVVARKLQAVVAVVLREAIDTKRENGKERDEGVLRPKREDH